MGLFKNREHSMLRESYTGGPHGVGDPNNKSLRNVEKEILIPKIMRERAREKCADVVQKFGECSLREGLAIVINCRQESNELKSCLAKWYTDPDFKKECTEIYLAERTRFRETGIRRKQLQRLNSPTKRNDSADDSVSGDSAKTLD